MIKCQGNMPHELIPYRWSFKYSGGQISSKKVESFMCSRCFELLHMADVHEFNYQKKADIVNAQS